MSPHARRKPDSGSQVMPRQTEEPRSPIEHPIALGRQCGPGPARHGALLQRWVLGHWLPKSRPSLPSAATLRGCSVEAGLLGLRLSRHGSIEPGSGAITRPGRGQPIDPIPVLVLARLALDRQGKAPVSRQRLLVPSSIRGRCPGTAAPAPWSASNAIDDRARRDSTVCGFLPPRGSTPLPADRRHRANSWEYDAIVGEDYLPIGRLRPSTRSHCCRRDEGGGSSRLRDPVVATTGTGRRGRCWRVAGPGRRRSTGVATLRGWRREPRALLGVVLDGHARCSST